MAGQMRAYYTHHESLLKSRAMFLKLRSGKEMFEDKIKENAKLLSERDALGKNFDFEVKP